VPVVGTYLSASESLCEWLIGDAEASVVDGSVDVVNEELDDGDCGCGCSAVRGL
jgi:hypothetical protein